MKKHVLSCNLDSVQTDKRLPSITAWLIKIFCTIISYFIFFLPSDSVILINFVFSSTFFFFVSYHVLSTFCFSSFIFVNLLTSFSSILSCIFFNFSCVLDCNLFNFSCVLGCDLFGFPLVRKSSLLSSNFLRLWFYLLFYFSFLYSSIYLTLHIFLVLFCLLLGFPIVIRIDVRDPADCRVGDPV